MIVGKGSTADPSWVYLEEILSALCTRQVIWLEADC